MGGSHIVGEADGKRETLRLYSGTVTTSGNSRSTPIISKYGKEGVVFLEITAASGVAPTLDITIEIQNPKTKNWHAMSVFTTKTIVGKDIGNVEYGVGEKMAFSYLVGGSNPSFTFTIDVSFKNI